MERITYRITLDAYKNGIQRTLQGFETADNMSRRIAINLTSGGDTFEIPSSNVVAMIYVTVPGEAQSINKCEIVDNTIIYDALPIIKECIACMQLKLIETRPDGAKKVLAYPKFAVEVTDSEMNDGNAQQTPAFTALEDAVAKAEAVYSSRLVNIEIDDTCVFKAFYADGTVYENDSLHKALYNGNALLSESWAKGGTGMRDDEETNNSKYFSDVSKSSSIDATIVEQRIREILEESQLQSAFTAFNVDFDDGELVYLSSAYEFDVDEDTGCLNYESDGIYDPDEMMEKAVGEYLDGKTEEIDKSLADMEEEIDRRFTQSETEIDRRLDESEAEVEQIRKELDASIDLTTTTSQTLSNSHTGGIKVLNLFGKSVQGKTSGNQLLNLRNGNSGSGEGVTFTNRGDGSYTRVGTATGINCNVWFAGNYNIPTEDKYVLMTLEAGKTYTIINCTLWTVKSNGSTAHVSGTTVIPESDYPDGFKVTGIRNPYVDNGVTYDDIIYPRVFEGSVDLGWEPYTGTIPSPNPEYPQPIVSAGQKLAEGNQLFDAKTALSSQIEAGLVTVNNDGSVTLNGTFNTNNRSFYVPLKAGTYYFSEVSGAFRSLIPNDSAWDKSFTIESDTEVLSYIANGTIENKTIYPIVSRYQDVNIEPYTGGVKKAYDVGIRKKLTGKNKLKVTDVMYSVKFDSEKGTVKSIATKNTANQTVKAIMWKDTDRIEIFFSVAGVGFKEFPFRKQEGYEKLTLGFNGDKEDATITCDVSNLKNGGLYKIVFVIDSISQNASSISGVMIVEESITDYTYEPYTEQTLTLNRVLRGIPVTDASLANYTDENGQMWCADYADVERKVWVLRIGVSVLNGVGNYLTNGPANTYCVNVDDMMKLKDYTGMILCDQYLCNAKSNTYAVDKCVTGYHDSKNTYPTQNWVYIRDSSYANVTELVNALKAKPITVYYPLVTPIEIPMTDEEIIALHSMKSCNGVTHITSDNVPDAPMLVKYGTSEVGALSLENGNLHVVNEVLNKQLEAKTEELRLQMENCLTANDFEVSGNTLIFKFL